MCVRKCENSGNDVSEVHFIMNDVINRHRHNIQVGTKVYYKINPDAKKRDSHTHAFSVEIIPDHSSSRSSRSSSPYRRSSYRSRSRSRSRSPPKHRLPPRDNDLFSNLQRHLSER